MLLTLCSFWVLRWEERNLWRCPRFFSQVKQFVRGEYVLSRNFFFHSFFFFDSRKNTLSSLSKVFCQKKSPLFYLIWIPPSKRIRSAPINGTPKRMSAISSVLKQFLTVNSLQMTNMLHICKKWVGLLIFLKNQCNFKFLVF